MKGRREMKRISSLICAMMLFLCLFSCYAAAEAEWIKANPPVTMPYAKPVLDGFVKESEGWSAPALFNNDTVGFFWGFNPLAVNGKMYFAYDDDGIYFAASITEQSYIEHNDQNGDPKIYEGDGFVPSTGEDKINVQPGGIRDYGWNGDVLTLMIDPCGALAKAGMDANDDYTAWYDISLFEDGKVHVYRGKVSPDEITSKCKAKGKTITDGWCVEVFIPWDVILKDTETASSGKVKLKKEEVTASGSSSRAAVMYMDRFVDPDSELVDTWGRYITVAETTTAGTPGNMSSGDNIGAFGLLLNNGEKPVSETSQVSEKTVLVTDEKGNAVTDSNGKQITEKAKDASTTKAAATGKGNSAISAQTFDAGISAAIGAVLVSAIGFSFGKKRK